ncbi:MAG TPA: AsmA-like C-terminal region-containing protein [Tepidisphaeraceae bacterium]|nr:AsmA-like C-terminal region-containing protein [Tepidisphaeraceae bacterium]
MIAAFVVFAVPVIVAHIAKSKLEAMVRENLNATLTMDGATYRPPYTLIMRDAKLHVAGPNGQDVPVVSIDELMVKLGGLPHKDTPLVIKQVVLDHPVVKLMSAPKFMQELRHLVRPTEHEGPKKALSEEFRMGNLTLNGGQISYDRETLRDLNADVKMDAKNPANYRYSFSMHDKAGFYVQAAGSYDIDHQILDTRKADVEVVIHSGDQDFLPGRAIRRIARDHASGRTELTFSAHVPLKAWRQSTFEAKVQLSGWRADNPKWPAPLDDLATLLKLDRPDSDGPMTMNIAEFHATSGPATLQIQRGVVTADTQLKSWKVTEFAGFIQGSEPTTRTATRASVISKAYKRYTILGRIDFTGTANGRIPGPGEPRPHVTYKVLVYPRDASFVVPRWQSPIEHIFGGPLLFTDHHALINNLSAHYGYDALRIVNAKLNLTDPSEGLGASEINAYMDFDRNSPDYPKPISAFVDALHPQGKFHAQGHCIVFPEKPGPKFDYMFDVDSRDVNFAVGPDLFPISHARLSVVANTEATSLKSFDAAMVGGTLTATGNVKTQGTLEYDAHATFTNVDVKRAYAVIASHGGQKSYEKNRRISGVAEGEIRVKGQGKSVDNLTADGHVRVTGAEFGDVPILSDIASASHLSDTAFTGSRAAAMFSMAHKVVRLQKFAVGAPAVGIQGKGLVGFNGDLQLQIVVAPLSSWKQKLKETGIPLIGQAAGALQSIVNGATRLLLYEFNVSGNIRKPKIVPVPVPILTREAGKLFLDMLNPNRQDLLQTMQSEQATTTTAPATAPVK